MKTYSATINITRTFSSKAIAKFVGKAVTEVTQKDAEAFAQRWMDGLAEDGVSSDILEEAKLVVTEDTCFTPGRS